MILNNYYSDLLSNIYVIARASAFISADAMNSINERYRPSQIMFGSLAICAVCLLLVSGYSAIRKKRKEA